MLVAIYQYRFRHAKCHLDHFAKGLQRHGQHHVWVPLGTAPVYCDLAVMWGCMRQDVMAAQQISGGRFLVVERGYIGNRKQWTSVGYDGLNGRADFCNRGKGPERFSALFRGVVKPWQRPGEYILVMGQCRWDQSVRHLNSAQRLAEAVAAIRAHSHLPIRFRPHPEDREMPAPEGSSLLAGSLEESLSRASCVVTLNSNSGVDAALAGVPVVALDRGSMAWDVAGHRSIEAILPPRPDREKWAAELAWCQWSEQELAQGYCWEHLKQGMKRGYRRVPQG